MVFICILAFFLYFTVCMCIASKFDKYFYYNPEKMTKRLRYYVIICFFWPITFIFIRNEFKDDYEKTNN